jgi:cytochrome P450 family 9
MRLMFQLMNDVTIRFCKSLTERIKSSGKNRYEFKDLTKKLSVDVIATTAFGIEINSFDNPENDFYVQTNQATNFASIRSSLVFAGFMFCRPIMRALKVTLFKKETVDFFESAVLGTMNERQQKGIIRHDFINLMMQVKKGILTHEADENASKNEGFASVEEHDIGMAKVKRQWDDMYLVAQSFGFFFAGFESVNNLKYFILNFNQIPPNRFQQR